MDIASLIIPVLVIIIASLTKRLIPSLIIGIITGGILLAKGNPIIGTVYSIDNIIKPLSDPESISVILFLFLFGSLAEVIKMSGGIKGFTNIAGKWVKDEKGAFISVWIASIVTFIDCCFHVIATGTISKPLIEKVNGNKRKLASIINITSCLLIILIPFGTTYAGYIVGTISTSLGGATQSLSPYSLFISSIPYNFYAILMSILALFLTFTKFGFKKLIKAQVVSKKALESSEHDLSEAHEQCEFEQKAAPRVLNLIIPLIILIASIFFFFWYTGRDKGPGFFGAIMNADFEKSILIASAITIILASIIYKFQKVPMKELEAHFLSGGNEMVPPITILILSWGLSSIVRELGFIRLVSQIASMSMPSFLWPVIIFLICCLASYFMGSAWGTWALLMPIAVPLAINLNLNLPLMIGAVLSGGSLGDNASPLGETAVLSATVCEIPLMEHVKSQLPYSLIGVGLAAVLFTFIPLLVH